MKQSDYDKKLLRWARVHCWDSLEKHKDLILRHMRTFAGDEPASPEKTRCVLWRGCKFVNTEDCGEHCESYAPGP